MQLSRPMATLAISPHCTFDAHAQKLRTKKHMNQTLQNNMMMERWEAVSEPGYACTEEVFTNYMQKPKRNRSVLNCAVTPARART